MRISCGHWSRCATRGCESEGRALRTGPGGVVAECEDKEMERKSGAVPAERRTEAPRAEAGRSGVEEWSLVLPARFGTGEMAGAWGIAYSAAAYRIRKLAEAGVVRATARGRWSKTGEDIPGPESLEESPKMRTVAVLDRAGDGWEKRPMKYERDGFERRVAMLPEEFGAGEAVRAWGLSRSPANRVLRIAEARGLIEKISWGRYKKKSNRRSKG